MFFKIKKLAPLLCILALPSANAVFCSLLNGIVGCTLMMTTTQVSTQTLSHTITATKTITDTSTTTELHTTTETITKTNLPSPYATLEFYKSTNCTITNFGTWTAERTYFMAPGKCVDVDDDDDDDSDGDDDDDDGEPYLKSSWLSKVIDQQNCTTCSFTTFPQTKCAGNGVTHSLVPNNGTSCRDLSVDWTIAHDGTQGLGPNFKSAILNCGCSLTPLPSTSS